MKRSVDKREIIKPEKSNANHSQVCVEVPSLSSNLTFGSCCIIYPMLKIRQKLDMCNMSWEGCGRGKLCKVHSCSCQIHWKF